MQHMVCEMPLVLLVNALLRNNWTCQTQAIQNAENHNWLSVIGLR